VTRHETPQDLGIRQQGLSHAGVGVGQQGAQSAAFHRLYLSKNWKVRSGSLPMAAAPAS
jgi:hypothetical protein